MKVRAAREYIYTLRRKDGYPSFHCAWYELGRRKTKTFASVDAAKLFAQQVHSSCRHELQSADPVAQRDFELFRACEARTKRFGLSLTSAVEEWSDAKTAVKGELHPRRGALLQRAPRRPAQQILPSGGR